MKTDWQKIREMMSTMFPSEQITCHWCTVDFDERGHVKA